MTVKTIRVRALEVGFDNLCIRNPGDEFDMPADVFDKREIKKDGVGTGEFYPMPSWIEPVEAKPAKKDANSDLV